MEKGEKAVQAHKMDSDEETVARLGHSISQKRQERDRYSKGIWSLQCYGESQYRGIFKYFSENYGITNMNLRYPA